MNSALVDAAERDRMERAEIASGFRMSMADWKAMLHYTCSRPTNPGPGMVYAVGPHRKGSNPINDRWYRVEVRASDEPGYVDHVSRRIVISNAYRDVIA